MAETINLKKRLIGKEDINFDITGTNEQENFFTSDGGAKQLSKLNASHIPLLQETRSKVNAVNVDDALVKISEKVDNFEASDVLGEDLTINFLPDDDTETIQLKINQQKKNLNGHTLTFLFPASLQQNLYQSLEWNDFYNGTVVIAGGREDSRIAIYDNLDINSLFRFYRCQCEVILRYFYFVHQYSPYAISAESSSAVIVEKCSFAGMEEKDSYAVNKKAANAVLLDCELAYDIEFYPPEKTEEKEEESIGKHLGETFAYPGAVPPEGAYLLNGQTIPNCAEAYKKFWAWVQSAGVRIIDNDTYEAELASAGVCGGFVLDTVTGSVRLPSVVNGTLWGASDANIGASLAAGLPNITGQFETAGVAATTTAKGAFTQVNHGNLAFHSGSNAMGGRTFTFDASGSSSVYGNSDTVQPPAIRVSWCIQVYNAATALSEQDSAQLASQMQMKAQTDLANINSNIDFVVESWSDGAGGWYRKYRSGWVEQGGIVPDTGGAKAETITFWVEMQNTNYTPKSTQTSNASSGSSSGRSVSCYNLTETGMDCYIFDTSTQGIRWEVKGFAATE